MLEIKNLEVGIHNTLYLRKHHPDSGNVENWKSSYIRGMEPIKASKGGVFFGIKAKQALYSSLAILCTLVFVVGWEGTPITNVVHKAHLAKFLTDEAGLPIGDEYVGVFMPPGCDYTKGRWIRDERGPLYSGKECSRWLTEMWACRLNNRTDFDYENFRWQPDDCDLPTFNGQTFLKRMRSKTLAFVGDSLGRQQFQSLMCLITGGSNDTEVEDVSTEYGLTLEPGALRPRPDGWAYRFVATNTTILFDWSASLCDLEPFNKSAHRTKIFMHLDRPALFLRENLRKFDVLILNTGHHWNMRKFKKNKWKMRVGGKRVKPASNLSDIKNAYNFTVHSVIRWLNSELETIGGLQAFFRTLSPRHFFNGDWDTGGRCDNTRLKSSGLRVMKGPLLDAVAESAVRGTRIKLLNITFMSQFRDEAHISKYSWKFKNGTQDCLHWCLPGVPDTWNQILYAQLFDQAYRDSQQERL